MAFLLSGVIFKGIEEQDSAGVEKQLITMLWVQNIWVSAVCIPYLIFLEDKPKFPPSLVALEKPKEAPFCQNIMEALKLPEYLKLIGAFMLM